VGDVYRSQALFSDADTSKVISTHLDLEVNVATPPTIAFVGDKWKQWWNVGGGSGNRAADYFANSIALKEVTLRKIKPLGAIVESYTTGLPINGATATDPGVPNTSILASLRTASVGRSYRGRMYFPNPPESVLQADQMLSAADAQDFADGIKNLLATLTTADFGPVVFSTVLNEGTPITSVRVDRRIRSQRRRQVRTPSYVTGV
jgi:hypothetical protein